MLDAILPPNQKPSHLQPRPNHPKAVAEKGQRDDENGGFGPGVGRVIEWVFARVSHP